MSGKPPAPIKPPVTVDDFARLDIGYANGLTPAPAIPEVDVPDGTRLG